MVKSREDSVIEIWSTEYINRDVNRLQEDICATIIQCEPGNTSGDYIVEVVRKEDGRADNGRAGRMCRKQLQMPTESGPWTIRSWRTYLWDMAHLSVQHVRLATSGSVTRSVRNTASNGFSSQQRRSDNGLCR